MVTYGTKCISTNSQIVFLQVLLFILKFSTFHGQLFHEFELPAGDRRKFYNEKEKLIIVETSLGKVMGLRNGHVNVYLGIPYAEPPVGKLRFRPPKPIRHWQPRIYNATNFSPECLQSTLFSGESDDHPMDEDCLYLNMWQPAYAKNSRPWEANRHSKAKLFPVLIWIYGGAFVHGGSSLPSYYGDKLAARGVIVVSFNYRLGALGFLVSTADGLFGNYGLDDQKTAIQWVQDHIISFGGDPDRVTLFGESAGAMSIGLHMLDQQSSFLEYLHKRDSGRMEPPKKLFHAAILQSNPLGYK
jgi:carboxylesterase type B